MTYIKKNINRKGFTIVELVVVVGIIAVISSIVVTGSQKFDSTILLTNLSYEIALSIREAQSAGLQVKEFKSGTASATFNSGYGVTFYTNNADNSVNNTDYILFADLITSGSAGDNVYNGDSNGGSEFVKKYSTRRGNVIEKFCGVMAVSGVEQCSDSSGGLSYLNIVFVRPNPDATFKSNTAVAYRAAKIYLKSAENTHRAVRIESTGQISVCSNVSC